MALLLPSIFNSSVAARQNRPFVLLQSSGAQSGLPILRQLIYHSIRSNSAKGRNQALLFCLLYPPATLVNNESPELEIFDCTGRVPGYDDNWSDARDFILSSVKNVPAGPLTIILDDVDTLSSDLRSDSKTYHFLHELFGIILARPSPSKLILHAFSPSRLIPLLIQPSFSSSLTHLIVHPPALLKHLASAYFTPPPPASPEAKFWGVFLPLSERRYESNRLVFGSGGEGSGSEEMVVEILVRGGREGSIRKRAMDRVVEGWSVARRDGCQLNELDSLKTIWTKKAALETPSDPTRNISFNLNLTPSQQHSRAQVPLPYAHEGKPLQKATSITPDIFYDPDSADDIDDDDPDEDLDI